MHANLSHGRYSRSNLAKKLTKSCPVKRRKPRSIHRLFDSNRPNFNRPSSRQVEQFSGLSLSPGRDIPAPPYIIGRINKMITLNDDNNRYASQEAVMYSLYGQHC